MIHLFCVNSERVSVFFWSHSNRVFAVQWVPYTFVHFCACPIHCRLGRRLGSCRLILVQPLIGSTIWVFSISSALWVLEVLSCLYWHSFHRTDHSTLWWMGVGVNWLTLNQECRSSVFRARYCSSSTLLSFFAIGENKLVGYADDSPLMVAVPSPGVRVAVAESLIRDLGRVSECCDLWGMKLNASKTKTMIVSRSRTMHHPSPH